MSDPGRQPDPHESPSRSGSAWRQAPNEGGGFETVELALALSHYDTGVISEIRPIRRGSSDAPKALLRTSRGTLLFKRRGRARSHPQRVAFSHRLQLHLASRGYPLPRLLGTRDENRSILQIGEHLYELFEYVAGDAYRGDQRETRAAGRALAILHRLTADFHTPDAPPAQGFHQNEGVERRLARIQELFPGGDQHTTAASLAARYAEAGERASTLGYDGWPKQVVHGDWHPGNVVFRHGDVSAALDYDAAHVDARCADVASGALQFSLIRGGDDLDAWPDHPDEKRLSWFLSGYDGVQGCRLSDSELAAVPALMVESLIAESAGPIAETGSFGRYEGAPFLRMIERKAAWLHDHQARVRALADSSPSP